jgi:hypothetical protein
MFERFDNLLMVFALAAVVLLGLLDLAARAHPPESSRLSHIHSDVEPSSIR